jgi:hypothetical protein
MKRERAMISYVARFCNRLRSSPGARRINHGNPVTISPDATVSLSQNGAVFLHARSGVVFTTNHIGARIWQGLVGGEGVETITQRISLENGVRQDQVRQHATEFIGELQTQGLLVRRMGY